MKRLPVNHQGRDFVLGDLHGCKKELDYLLEHVRFSHKVDRLISVGDLIDRGPSSLECLTLLRAPWFHAVMGNHEQLLLNFYESWLWDETPPDPYSEVGSSFLVNGGKWALLECDDSFRPTAPLKDLLALVSALPQVIVVGEGASRFNVVHAELTRSAVEMGSSTVWTDSELDELPPFASIADDFPEFRWSRGFMGSARRLAALPTEMPGLSLTFCGHTVGPVRKALSHVCLDTGAFVTYRTEGLLGRYGLTVAEVRTRRWVMRRGRSVVEGRF